MATDTLTHATAHAHEHGHHDAGQNKIFGFWVYLMSDCILFSILFAYLCRSGERHRWRPDR